MLHSSPLLVGGVNSATEQDPQLAETQGMIALALSTWKEEFKSEYR